MANKTNDWFAINLLNDDVNKLDLVAENINSDNTFMQSKEYYKGLNEVQEKFRTDTGKFDEKAFDEEYASALATYNQLATEDFEKDILSSMEQHPDYWFEPSSPIRDVSATVTLSDDPYHRGMGLSGLRSVSDPNWSVREIAQAQEATDENGNGLGWSPNDHALANGSLKSLWQPTLAIAAWDEDGYHTDEEGNKVKHRKGEYKLRNGEFYYEKLGGRSAVGKDILRLSDTVTVDGTWLNKIDVFDADSVEKSAGGVIMRTALELAPLLIPQVAPIYGMLGAIFHTAEVAPALARTLNGVFGKGEDSEFGKTLNRANNWFKRFSDTQSDKGRSQFMSFESVGQQITGIANQLYQQKFVGKLGHMLASGGEKWQGGSKLGSALSTAYMATTSSMDFYETSKEAGLNDTWAGIVTLASMCGFYALMNNDYYKQTLFGENSLLNEEFVERNTLKAVGEELGSALRGVPSNPTPIEAKGMFQKVFESVKRNGGKAIKKIKNGLAKEEIGTALATSEAAIAETTEKAATKLTVAQVKGKAKDAVKNGILGESKNAGSSWFNIMLNRASNEAIEEMMEEAMQDITKCVSLGAEKLGWTVKDEDAEKVDWGFSFEDFFTRYLTAGIGGFVGGSIFAGLDKWEKIWSPNMREITSKGISNGERIAYIIKEGGKNSLMKHIDKLQKTNSFGPKNLSFKGTPHIDMDGNTTWNFEETTSENESQNAVIADALRAYVNYVEGTLKAYDFVNDTELSKILRTSHLENQAAVDKLKTENQFAYKQLEKALNKENKKRKEQGLPETTIVDMYETYNYADGVIRAMDKCGFFEDFYHDYLMLGVDLIGAQYKLDCAKRDYELAHPHDNTGWESSSAKQKYEDQINEINKKREAIMRGERNAEYIQRALYMVYDPVNSTFIDAQGETDEKNLPLAERSVFNYAMYRYGIDLNNDDLTTDEKEELTKEFEEYKKLKRLDKVKASYDVFINLADALKPAMDNYVQTQKSKTINEYFSTETNDKQVESQINYLKTQLSQITAQINAQNPDTAVLDGWDDDDKKYVEMFQNLGVSLGSITWVSQESVPKNVYGWFDPRTNSFTFVKGKDPEETKKTIIHEVVGHYGLKQLFNGPMKATIDTKLATYKKQHPDIVWSNATSAIGNTMDQIMDVLFDIANDDVRIRINERLDTYGYTDTDFQDALTNWNQQSDPTASYYRAQQLLQVLQKQGFINTIDPATIADPAVRKSIKEAFSHQAQRIAVEEYLAELAAETLNGTDLSKSDKDWFSKIVDFFRQLFSISSNTADEGFFAELMVLSKNNLQNTSKAARYYNIITNKNKYNPNRLWWDSFDRSALTSEEIASIVNESYSDWNHNDFITNWATSVSGIGGVPPVDFSGRKHLPNVTGLEINSFSDLIDYITFGTNNITGTKIDHPVDSMFVAVSYPNRITMNEGISIIGYNSNGINAAMANELQSKIAAIAPEIKLVPMDDLLNEVKNLKRDWTSWKQNLPLEVRRFLTGKLLLQQQLYIGSITTERDANGNMIPMFGNTISLQTASKQFGEIEVKDTDFLFCTAIDGGVVIPNGNDTIFYLDNIPDNVKALLEGTNPTHFYLGNVNGKHLIVPMHVYDSLSANEELTSIAQMDTEMDLLLQAKKTIEDQLEKLDQIATSARATETDKGLQLTNEILDLRRDIFLPWTDALQDIKDAIQKLQDYSDYCSTNNVWDPNMRYVFEQIEKLKDAWSSRLQHDVVSLLAGKLKISETFVEQMIDAAATLASLDFRDVVKRYVNAQFDGDLTEIVNSCFSIDCIIGCNLQFFQHHDDILNLFSQTPLLDKRIEDLENSFTPNSEEIQKVLEELKVNRIGETITLNKWIQLMLKGTEPKSTMKVQDYVMENSDAKELIDNLNAAYTVLQTMFSASTSNGIPSLFQLYNVFVPDADWTTYLGDSDEIINVEWDTLRNKLNYLKAIAGLSNERQIKVQKGIAKEMHFRLVKETLNLGKIFNVDFPELWDEVGGNINTLNPNMSDSEYVNFLQTLKKFEHRVYEAFTADDTFKNASGEEVINEILSKFPTGTTLTNFAGEIADGNIDFTPMSLIGYVLSLATVDSSIMYNKLQSLNADGKLPIMPFPSQLFTIQMGLAYVNDTKGVFNALNGKTNAADSIFLNNVMGIFGSAGTGKTTIIAKILTELLSDKKILLSSNGESQLDKLRSSIESIPEENTFVTQELIDEIAPDWQTNIKTNTSTAKYIGTVKSSTKYDDKLKDSIIIVDEATLLDERKWQALSQYASIHNIKILALGDLKQQGETEKIIVGNNQIRTVFTDLNLYSTPILTESVRPNNQAQRNNLILLGKALDNSINCLKETLRADLASNMIRNNPIVLKYKNVPGKLIGTNSTTDINDFKSKIQEVVQALQTGETVAIITESNEYDSLKSNNVEVLRPNEMQGREWTYVFSDLKLDINSLTTMQLAYTIISRCKQGSLIFDSNGYFDLMSISFGEDLEGDLSIAASANQFAHYGDWMKSVLFNGTVNNTTNNTVNSPTSSSSTTGAASGGSPRIRHRFESEFNAGFLTNPDVYVQDIDSEIINSALSNAPINWIKLYDDQPIATYKGRHYTSVKIGDNFITFVRSFNSSGDSIFVPIRIGSAGEIEIDTSLSKSSVIKQLGLYLATTYRTYDYSSATKLTNNATLVENLLTGQNAETAFEDFIQELSIETLADIESELGDDNRDVDKVKTSLIKVKRTQNNIDDNFYVKKLQKNLFGNAKLRFTATANNSAKQKAVKIIADLVKTDAKQVSGTATKTTHIDAKKLTFIKQELLKVFDSSVMNNILTEVFKDQKTFYIKDTGVAYDKELYLVVGDMHVYIGEIRNASWAEGYYEKQAGTKFNIPFRRQAISSKGKKRVAVDKVFEDGLFNYAPPAVVVGNDTKNPLYASILQQAQAQPDNTMLQRFVKWIKVNNGKTMQVYTNLSYLDLSDPINVYQVQQQTGFVIDPTTGNKIPSTHPFAYDSRFGDMMGIQKAISLYQLYSYSILIKYAETGDSEYGAMARHAFPDITDQHSAIAKVRSLLGSNAGMTPIPDNIVGQQQKDAIWENTLKFNRSGLLLNHKSTEKIETLMLLAALSGGSGASTEFFLTFTNFAQVATKKNRQFGGFSFKYYAQPGFNGDPEREFKIVHTRKNGGTWSLYEVIRSGNSIQNKLVTEMESALFTESMFAQFVGIIMTEAGETISSGTSLIDLLAQCKLSIQPSISWEKIDKNGIKTYGVNPINIVDFFVNLLENPKFPIVSGLFKTCEDIYLKSATAEKYFGSDIYLETRSEGSNYVPQSGNATESFWKKDVTETSEVPYSTDIVRIYNPIRTIDLVPTTANGPTVTYDYTTDANVVSKIQSNHTIIANNIFATTVSEFRDKLNEQIKSDAINKKHLRYSQYDNDFNVVFKYNEESIQQLLDAASGYTQVDGWVLPTNILLQKDGKWFIYSEDGSKLMWTVDTNIKDLIINISNSNADFKRQFILDLGKGKVVDSLKLISDKATRMNLFNAFKAPKC